MTLATAIATVVGMAAGLLAASRTADSPRRRVVLAASGAMSLALAIGIGLLAR